MSFFRILYNNCKLYKKTIVSPGKNLLNQEHILKILTSIFGKRMSLISSLKTKRLKASMAVEAALSVPFFLFFLMNILFVFDMLRLHGNIMGAIHQTGNKMAFYGYAYKNGLEETGLQEGELSSFLLSEGYARREVINILGEDYLNHTCLTSGVSGLHFLKSSILIEEDRIKLIASYKVKPFIRIIGFPDIPMENRYYGRAWTGYDVENKRQGEISEDQMVYIAENGTVYHTARDCSYLNPSIEAVSLIEADTLRNENGEKYYFCGSFKGNAFQAIAYVTSYGSKIHNSINCPGLKRTIYTMPLSKVKERGKCTKCGG